MTSPSNTAWARELADEIWLAVMTADLPERVKGYIADTLLAVERKAKKECARIAWPHKYPCTAGSNTSVADALSWAIAAAIRSTLPPTSKE